MKRHFRGSKEPQSLDPDFVDALCENESTQQSSQRQAERKAKQFCRQVQRALNLALADRNESNLLAGLFVEEVLPAPDCGRLLVYVLIPGNQVAMDTIRELNHDAPRLRSEVAMAITRKRAPELCFVPVHSEGDGNE